MINKILDKIKKLLELATSPNEAEAELAMSQAQKLMAKYSIDKDALHKDNNKDPEEIVEESYESIYFSKQGVLESMISILATIPPIFGVFGVILKNGDKTRGFKLVGFKDNIEMAKYALDSILTQGVIDARREYKKFRTVTFGQSFWSGFSVGLHRQFSKFTEQTNELIIYDRVKAYLDLHTTGKSTSSLKDGIAFNTGIKSGLDATIRKPLTNSNEGKLLN